MKLLLDQGLPRTAAALLRQAGIDSVHVGEIGYAAATDASILERARNEERVVVTLDADFHALVLAICIMRTYRYAVLPSEGRQHGENAEDGSG